MRSHGRAERTIERHTEVGHVHERLRHPVLDGLRYVFTKQEGGGEKEE
jgi:hypothetical protein